jgi:hypothetical protein
MRNIVCFTDQLKRDGAWKQRSESEKLFWLVLLSSGPHEKLYGPVFCLVHLQPALQYTGPAVVQKKHNGALQTERSVWGITRGGVQERRIFNKETYWQWAPSVRDEAMSLSVIHTIRCNSYGMFLFVVSRLNTISALDGGELLDPPALSLGNSPRYPVHRRVGGPHIRFGRMEKRRTSSSYLKSNPNFSVIHHAA